MSTLLSWVVFKCKRLRVNDTLCWTRTARCRMLTFWINFFNFLQTHKTVQFERSQQSTPIFKFSSKWKLLKNFENFRKSVISIIIKNGLELWNGDLPEAIHWLEKCSVNSETIHHQHRFEIYHNLDFSDGYYYECCKENLLDFNGEMEAILMKWRMEILTLPIYFP